VSIGNALTSSISSLEIWISSPVPESVRETWYDGGVLHLVIALFLLAGLEFLRSYDCDVPNRTWGDIHKATFTLWVRSQWTHISISTPALVDSSSVGLRSIQPTPSGALQISSSRRRRTNMLIMDDSGSITSKARKDETTHCLWAIVGGIHLRFSVRIL